jgi:hypothetical protein
MADTEQRTFATHAIQFVVAFEMHRKHLIRRQPRKRQKQASADALNAGLRAKLEA